MSIDWSAELGSILTSTAFPSLETVLCSPDYFGLTTASPLQRAICRVATGQPLAELADHPHVLEAIGRMPEGWKMPREFYLVAGIRTGKSLFNAARAVHMAQTVDLSKLGPGETARVSILATSVDIAKPTYDHVVGRCINSPILGGLLAEVPKKESLLMRQAHTGKCVEIAIVAGSKGGSSTNARWSAGCVADEAPRWGAAGSSVVNLKDLRHNILERLLPGSQFMATGSPWAPEGEIFDVIQKYWKNPVQGLVAIKGRGDHMNPSVWTPEKCAEAERNDPNVFLTECMAEFASPEENLFSVFTVDRCTRAGGLQVVPHIPGRHYVAAMDPGMKSNGWTLVIATKVGERRIVVYANEWRGTKAKPLDPEQTMREICNILKSYEIKYVYSDRYAIEMVQMLARKQGCSVIQKNYKDEERVKYYMGLKNAMDAGLVEIPENQVLRTDLFRVKKRPSVNGSLTFPLPETSDGRHCDYIPSLVLSVGSYCLDEDEPLVVLAEKEQWDILGEKLKKARFEEVKKQNERNRVKINVRRSKW